MAGATLSPDREAWIDGRLAAAGQWMQRHGAVIRGIQWVVVAVYIALLVVPAVMPLPDGSAHLWTNLTLAAQFVFWGIWWPFVLLSMVMLGRVWCGVLCPEGALTEFASKLRPRLGDSALDALGRLALRRVRHARPSTARWSASISIRRRCSLVLGGSTVAAMIIGCLYGREKRVWCKYLCPVNGVFSLARAACAVPLQGERAAWRASSKRRARRAAGQLRAARSAAN